MPLNVGDRIAHYDVTALIGEGGMGQVYQATDTKLNRQVALKILPEAFATDPDRLARFQREAQVLASLNHPNIAQIHGVEEEDGTRAVVLELVEGPTLADRISKGPISLGEALPIAKQIAEALEAAHEAGVIHRDLKPANIKVREDGTVKVLDFGLAKALDPTPTGDPSESPTLTASATQMGVIMGTAAYMSPEQARGKPLDKRTDIWAFGCVLYEMLTGRLVFGGETLSDTIANVLDRQPQWATLPTGTPRSVRRLLQRCLDKNPKERLRDIGDARVELRPHVSVATDEQDLVGQAPPSYPGVWRRAVPWVLATGAAVVAIVVVSAPENPRPVTRFYATTFESPALAETGLTDMSIAPDGNTLVYTAGDPASGYRLIQRSVDGLHSMPVVGGNGGGVPFFSPDGRWIGFGTFPQHVLMRVPSEGGAPETIAPLGAISTGYSLD